MSGKPPAGNFVTKLYSIVNDSTITGIEWSSDGKSFIIASPSQFGTTTLKQHFKHGNISSFVRQLNKYDFHKIRRNDIGEDGELKWEFCHEKFQRDREDLLSEIKRKVAEESKEQESTPLMEELQEQIYEMARTQRDMVESLQILAKNHKALVEEVDYLRKYIHDNIPINTTVTTNTSWTASSSTYAGAGYILPSPNNDNHVNSLVLPNITDLQRRMKPFWASPPKILLVEDDVVCRRYGAKMLELLGCECSVAVDGLDAIKQIQNKHFDIVLMDIRMPNLDGIAATKHIRMYDKRTPIISMTGHLTQEECLNYLASGMNDILEKPLSKEAFINIVNRYCCHLKLLNNECFNNEVKRRKIIEFPRNVYTNMAFPEKDERNAAEEAIKNIFQ